MVSVRYTALSLHLVLASCAIVVSVLLPSHNWDVIGYIASAKAFEETSSDSLQAFTYSQLRNSLTEEKFEQLSNGNVYRYNVYTDATAFAEQLAFYQVRPVYVLLVYVMYKIGINIVFSTHLISGLSVATAILLMYFMLREYISNVLLYSLPVLATVFGVISLARLSTPDGLAFLATMVCAYLYVKAKYSILLPICTLVVAIRSDLILFIIPLLFFVLVLKKVTPLATVISAGISIGVVVAIEVLFSYPGWATVMYHTHVMLLSHPISSVPTLTVQQYLAVLQMGVLDLLNDRTLLLFLAIEIYAIYLIVLCKSPHTILTKLRSSPFAVLALVSLFFVASHFLAFPSVWERFFTGPCLIGSCSLLSLITDYIRFTQLPVKDSNRVAHRP